MTSIKTTIQKAAIALMAVLQAQFIPAGAAETDASEFEQPDGIQMGIYVEDILSGEVLADARADEPFIPASIMKAVTAATVVTLFDPYVRFATKVTATGSIDGTTLNGNIVVHATGDPTLESSRFPDYTGFCDSIAEGLIRAGIDSVTGVVMVDYSSMPESGIPSGWMEEDRKYRYGAGHHPINWHDNAFTLTMPDMTTDPLVPDLDIKFNKRRRGAMKYTYNPGAMSLTITGRPVKRTATTTYGLPDPAASMCADICKVLSNKGLKLGLHAGLNPSQAITIYTHTSPTLDEILRTMMYWSDNTQAEAMLRIIAPTEPRDVAAERELALWKMKGADTDNVSIVDGSGLSRNDRLTPLFLADVMTSMALGPNGMAYATLFPIAGRNGTVRRLLADTPLSGRMALKSGTMSGVRCVAGFMLDSAGYPTHTVVVMTNATREISSTKLNQAIERALLKIFQ